MKKSFNLLAKNGKTDNNRKAPNFQTSIYFSNVEDFKSNLEQAKQDVNERIWECDEPFSSEDIEDIMLENGLEMDYIFDIL